MSPEDSPPVYCEVALPKPLLQTFTYRLPAGMRERARPGSRLLVPFGRRRAVGCIDRVKAEAERGGVKDALALLDEEPALGASLLALCRWVADYYVAPLGLVHRAALPPGALSESAPAPVRTRQVIRLRKRLPTLAAREELFGRAHRQREAYEVLEAMGPGSAAAVSHLSERLGFSRSVLHGLVEKGVAEIVDAEERRDPFASLERAATAAGAPARDTPGSGDGDGSAARSAPGAGPDGTLAGLHGAFAGADVRLVPTPEQQHAIHALRALAARREAEIALLRGVTGSGKTLVYLELLETVVSESGRGAIVLVPEISLTPQTLARFRARFGDRVAVLHSGLSAGERHDEWRALREGRKRIAIGPRSAVFAPVRDLGAVIVDEEHEGSYKQSETPRYHARAVAAVRARLESCLCLLGSATPALESWANARGGRYRLLELADRVTGHPLPRVELVDLREEAGADHGDRSTGAPSNGADAGRAGDPSTRWPRIFSPRLESALARRLEQGEQAILLLNRRGYATFVQCTACGKVWGCGSCNVSLTYHRRRARMVCHHCGYQAAPPAACDECGAPEPSYTGVGTEQVERRLGELFPAARVARMDMDTTGTKWAHFEILERVRRREVDVLLGTQMIAKGHDFPNVTLVGVVNADVSLNLPDFRASERTFQLLSQVAGRAGRGDRPGEVLVQTSRPSHFALRAAAAHDYAGFAARELADREEPGYPPHRRLANLVVSGTDEETVADEAADVAAQARELIHARKLTGIEVVGPAPCPIDRVRGRWRWHFLLKADRASVLGPVLRWLAERHGSPAGATRLEIDRDPEALL